MYTYKNDISGESVTIDFNGLIEVVTFAVIMAKDESYRALNDFQNASFPNDENSNRDMNRAAKKMKESADRLQRSTEVYEILMSLSAHPEYHDDFRSQVKIVNLPERVKELIIK